MFPVLLHVCAGVVGRVCELHVCVVVIRLVCVCVQARTCIRPFVMPCVHSRSNNGCSRTDRVRFIVFVSMFLSFTHILSHAHPFRHPHSLSHSLPRTTHTYSLTLTPTLTLSRSHILAHIHTYTHTLSLSLSHTHTHSLTYTQNRIGCFLQPSRCLHW